MPVRELMQWVATQQRWVRQHGGKRYWVGFRTLSKEFPLLVKSKTKDGTRDAANSWWERQVERLKEEEPNPLPGDYQQAIAEFELMRDWALEQGDTTAAVQHQQSIDGYTEAGSKPGAEPLLRAEYPIYGLDQTLQAVWADRKGRKKAVPADRTIAAQVKVFLDYRRTSVSGGTLTADRWEVIRVHLDIMQAFIGADRDVGDLNESAVVGFFAYLSGLTTAKKEDRRSAHYVHDVFGTFKMFCRHLWELRLIELPRKLDDKKLVFNRKDRKIVTWTDAEIQQFLADASPRTTLYALLMLNCGFYSTDIASLRHGEVDWKAGRIIRKRYDEEDGYDVPEVNWKLWSKTFKLLKEHRSEHGELVLLNEDDGPLRVSKLDDEDKGKYKKSDNVRSAFTRVTRKLKLTKSPKELRKTAASKLEEHDTYGRYAQHFLGHSPGSVAGKHYVAPSQDQFDAAVTWLGKQFKLS